MNGELNLVIKSDVIFTFFGVELFTYSLGNFRNRLPASRYSGGKLSSDFSFHAMLGRKGITRAACESADPLMARAGTRFQVSTAEWTVYPKFKIWMFLNWHSDNVRFWNISDFRFSVQGFSTGQVCTSI